LDQLLSLNPAARLTARQALDHEYFRVEPMACEGSKLPRIEIDTHEYQVVNRMRFEQMKLFSKKEKAVDHVHFTAKKRALPNHYICETKTKEPPKQIK